MAVPTRVHGYDEGDMDIAEHTAADLESTNAAVHDQYRERLEARRRSWKELERRDLTLGYAKVAVAVLGILALWVLFGIYALTPWLAVIPLALFVALAVVHDRVIRERERAQYAMAFYEQGLRRLEDRWVGTGKPGDRFADPQHPYAVDLDIFGRGSLYELLCTARTRVGEETLAEWFKFPAESALVRARQEAVAELRPMLDLREEMAALGEEGLKGLDAESLARWGQNPVILTRSAAPIGAAILGAATVSAAIYWMVGGGWVPFLALAVAGQAWEAALKGRVNKVILAVDKPASDLQNLAGILVLIERQDFAAPLLREIWNRVEVAGVPASGRIARLESMMDRLNARRNVIFAPIAALLLWTTCHAFAIERWREENGKHLEDWLAAIGEFEALSSLAGFAYEHPNDPFPEVVEGGICFEGVGLSHPLIPESRAVPNDVSLGDSARVWIVSGSNMSGKSTLLRTVGVNAVLAMAGAPVRAESLRISPMQIGASIRTLDSLLGGVSRFYAEVLRLRQIVEMADSGPLIFLLDEILHGTNSHDRLIGAEAVVKTLVEKGAVGLVTTHDLALARIAEDPNAGAKNVHFQDHLEDGEMRFDYRLQPGVVTKSNALELMRSVGLEV